MRVPVAIVAAVLLPCIALLGAVTWRIPLHNVNLRAFQRSFAALSHPSESQLVMELSEFGNFGESNHCDYVVGEFRSTSLPRGKIEQYYESTSIPSPDRTQHAWDGEPPAWNEVEVAFEDDGIFQWYPWSEWWSRVERSSLPSEKTYLIFASADGYPPRGDYRCH